jgi:hypothetical protein
MNFHFYIFQSVRIQTLDTLNKTKELYAFIDIARDSPDPNLPLNVDIGEGLKVFRIFYICSIFLVFLI